MSRINFNSKIIGNIFQIDEKVLKLRNLMAMHKFKLDMTASEFFNESVTNLPIDEGFVNVQVNIMLFLNNF